MTVHGSYASGFAPRDGQPLYPELWQGCVGAWAPCLGPTGLTLRDWSGFGNHGVLTGMLASDDWLSSQGKYALNFDGSNNSITLPASYNEGLSTESFSITAWANLRSQTSGAVVARFSNSRLFQLYYETFSFWGWRVSYGVSPFDDIRVGSLATLNRWYFLAFVFRSGVGQFFVDGNLIGTDAAVTGSFNDTAPLSIGRRGGDNAIPLNGLIDDVRFYNRGISTSEVRQLSCRRGIAYDLAPRRRSRIFTGGFKAYWAARKAQIIGGGL